MKTKIKITGLTMILVLAITTVASAQYGRRNVRNFQGKMPLEYCLDIPGLTDQQKEKITAVNKAHRDKMDELRQKRQTSPTWEEANQASAGMLLQQNEHIKQVKAILTDEQKVYLDGTYLVPRNRSPRNAPAYNGRGGGRGFRNAAYGRGGGRGAGRGYYGRDYRY